MCSFKVPLRYKFVSLCIGVLNCERNIRIAGKEILGIGLEFFIKRLATILCAHLNMFSLPIIVYDFAVGF